jgi:hypothetical protein
MPTRPAWPAAARRSPARHAAPRRHPGKRGTLLAVAAVAIGIGFGASAMYAATEMGLGLVAPGAAYYVMTCAGIMVALGLIAATFPLLRRSTGPETARTD